MNFRDISQFLKFYPKISDAIEASFPDFERAWKHSPEEENSIYDVPVLRPDVLIQERTRWALKSQSD